MNNEEYKERINNLIKTNMRLNQALAGKDKEIKRLNNIIKELKEKR